MRQLLIQQAGCLDNQHPVTYSAIRKIKRGIYAPFFIAEFLYQTVSVCFYYGDKLWRYDSIQILKYKIIKVSLAQAENT